ncbi:aminoglycoside phosphotransferase [Actinoallomurus purpureus]|uniref:aminoglycoside phosphotransferase n=1 Tax=Actinoallomurus purpureus TaxID=478114 RepID=UPI0020921B99|nr:aminoglycoside phosphotransferase [Actinoallomurus purpureus]MCO6007154.1 aminoglycoside phosphotransferase [Actinoallomurus purpureus]
MTELADENHRAWMRDALDHAARLFGLELIGAPVFGWRDRSISAAVVPLAGGVRRWLRVVAEHLSWTGDDWWTGNRDAAAITGIAKPRVIDAREWADDGQALRAEVMTYIAGRPCSPTPELHHGIDLPPSWWHALRDGLDHLADVPTNRRAIDQDRVSTRLRIFFGDQIDTRIDRWTTAHADLHWANLTAPELAVLDWEMWGRAPYGYDAATLHCHSLLQPGIAQTMHDTFAYLLDTPDGRRTQLFVITNMLMRADRGDYLDLVIPLHHHAHALLTEEGVGRSRSSR